MPHAQALPGVGGEAAQELLGVEVAAEAVEVCAVGPQRVDARGEVIGDVDGVRGLVRAHLVDVGGARPRFEFLLEQLGEDPPVGGGRCAG